MSISYEIDGEIYEQKPLVLGQMGQLTELLKGVVIPPDINRLGVISLLGNKLPAALAVVLTPKGCKVRDKDIEAVEKELEFSMSPEIAIQVIEDFFYLQPDSIALGADRGDGGEDNGADRDSWLDQLVCILSGGDITKREEIIWGYTLKECEPYLKYQERQLLFREAVIGFLVGETKEDKQKRVENEYCKACKTANKAVDCSKCSRDINIKEAK